MYQRTAAIVGAAHSRLGEIPGATALGLMAEAAVGAIADAGLTSADIDGLIVRGPDDEYCFQQQLGERLGLDVAWATSLDNGGASQPLAVLLAALAIEAGLATTVLCGYARDAWSRTRQPASRKARLNQATHHRLREWRDSFGYFGEPATHALGAQRHMSLFGTTREHLGHVAVTQREHAARNPHAQMRAPLTMAEYLDARLVAEPFGVYDCSLRTDAGAAVVVTAAQRARDLPHTPVIVRGFGSHNNLSGWTVGDHMVETAAKRSGERAYRMADVTPADIDTAQLYDCFTYMVLAQIEDYGFCPKGEGGEFIASGALRLDGAIPTNTSGGQLSEGHVEGMLQIVEGVRQLRHEYPPDRQVPDARLALVSGHGGNTVCHTTLILERG
ncbi:MAG: thiolase family protein [Micromonosporaceae bacterium]|nr:thiolase family protein [Micromonosporaceae bacterium]